MDTPVESKAAVQNARPLPVMLRQRAMQKVYNPRPAPVLFPLGGKGRTLYPFAANTIGATERITYLEFGVFQGNSIRRMAELFTHPESRFVGFDSFAGLPAAGCDKQAGAFSTEGKTPGIDDVRVSFVKGYFFFIVTGFI